MRASSAYGKSKGGTSLSNPVEGALYGGRSGKQEERSERAYECLSGLPMMVRQQEKLMSARDVGIFIGVLQSSW